ncbi:MAG: calcium/sodium antiporter [Gammaproteobacteria bacterium]|nr:calcium/sodium antiporter [Gammaproteobacteria bacterium]
MFIAIAAVLVGLGLLIWSADRFVDGASATAKHLGMSPMLIGLTIVAFGTSAPEMLVSTMAALEGSPGLAIGNAIGSNIANIALVLGATALVAPIPLRGNLVRTELPILTVATIGAGIIMLDHYLDIVDSLLLLFGLVLCLYLFKRYQQQHPEDQIEPMADLSLKAGITWFIVGLVVLAVGSRILVGGAVYIATALGVSNMIIGLTIIAIGTSLPELAASIMSARKGQHGIALGNIIGSNIFNLLGVMAIPALISPVVIEADALWRDYGLMLALTLFILVLGFKARRGGTITRIIGGLLLLIYVMYMLLLYTNAT